MGILLNGFSLDSAGQQFAAAADTGSQSHPGIVTNARLEFAEGFQPICHRAVGYDNQPDFINAAIQVETDIPAPALMQLLLTIEQTFGRERPFPNAPRILDLDLLDYAGMRMQTEQLTLPHPRMHERGFVIMPLAEIVPDFILPQGQTVVEWATDFPHDDVRKLDAQTLDH